MNMKKWGKINKTIVLIPVIIFIIILGSDLITIIKVKVTEGKVAKSRVSNQYFINAKDEESKIEIFKKFMSLQGWEFSEIYYGKIFFRKGNLQKEIEINSLIIM